MASAATPTFGFVGTTFVNRTPPHVSQPVLKQNACLFMDRGGSLREGAAKELPALNQSDCTAHVWGNVKKQAGYKKLKQTEKKELKKAFYEASNALMTSACDVALATIKSISSGELEEGVHGVAARLLPGVGAGAQGESLRKLTPEDRLQKACRSLAGQLLHSPRGGAHQS
jgi:hypothetical protein